MPDCAICGELITAENDSREHIIASAIGGRLKVRGILCAQCNNDTGKSWDAALAEQLNPLCLLFGITRDRGVTPPQTFATISGKRRRLHADGTSTPANPSYREESSPEGIRINMTARTVPEARKMLAGVKRKYPQVDTDKLAAELKMEKQYDSDPVRIDLPFGEALAGRSIVKSALCLAARNGIDPSTCALAQAYLRGDDSNPPFGFNYQAPIVLNRPADTVFHFVAIQGIAHTGLLIGYVEFFSFHRMVVLLSDRYGGPDMNASYAVNPLNGEKLQIQFDISLSRDEIDATFRYERISEAAMQEAFAKIMPIAMARSLERETHRVIDDAVRHAFANSGLKAGEAITAEHIATISTLAADTMMPFLNHIGWDWRKAASAAKAAHLDRDPTSVSPYAKVAARRIARPARRARSVVKALP